MAATMAAAVIGLAHLLAASSPAGSSQAGSSQAGAQPVAADRVRVSLDGAWRFAVDPTRTGEADRWFAPDLDESRWDRVDVPHCWPVDPRFQYTGTAWYRRTFDVRRICEAVMRASSSRPCSRVRACG
jgi:hypothetical protein